MHFFQIGLSWHLKVKLSILPYILPNITYVLSIPFEINSLSLQNSTLPPGWNSLISKNQIITENFLVIFVTLDKRSFIGCICVNSGYNGTNKNQG